jgi:lysophospholipase L1-like esterase
MRECWVILALLTWLAQPGCAQKAATPKPKQSADFDAEVARLEAKNPAPLAADGVLFVGSSSIRRWDLEAAFPGLKTRNHGFGGSRTEDLNHFAPRLVLACRPARLVVYEADNDIHEGLTPEQVAREADRFLTLVAEKLPEAKTWWLAIKPSPARRGEMDRQRQANDLIRKRCAASGGKAVFVDTWTPILGPDGQPDPALFLEDNLHLNEQGYARWQAVLEPLLKGGS